MKKKIQLSALSILAFVLVVGSASSNQESVDCIRNILNANHFNNTTNSAITRTMSDYVAAFGPAFGERVKSAAASDHFVDLGAGRAVAARQLAGESVKDIGTIPLITNRSADRVPNVTAISFKTNRVIRGSDKFAMLTGQYFENIPPAQIIGRFGKVSTFTDYWGVMAYTHNPTRVLSKILQLGRDDFQYYIKAQGFGSSLHTSKVIGENGKEISLVEWLSSLPGFSCKEVGDGSLLMTLVDRKKVKIPNLKLISVNDAVMPPMRTFRETGESS